MPHNWDCEDLLIFRKDDIAATGGCVFLIFHLGLIRCLLLVTFFGRELAVPESYANFYSGVHHSSCVNKQRQH